MEKKTKRIYIRATDAQFADAARQAHRAGWTISRYALAALQAYAMDDDQAQRVGMLVEQQTAAIASALADQFTAADEGRAAALTGVVQQITAAVDARDTELRADLRRSLDRIANAVRDLRAKVGGACNTGAQGNG